MNFSIKIEYLKMVFKYNPNIHGHESLLCESGKGFDKM